MCSHCAAAADVWRQRVFHGPDYPASLAESSPFSSDTEQDAPPGSWHKQEARMLVGTNVLSRSFLNQYTILPVHMTYIGTLGVLTQKGPFPMTRKGMTRVVPLECAL